MTTATEFITDALIDINALAVGQALPAANAAAALRRFNDLLDSLSTDKDFIYTTVENVLNWIGGTYKYTIGNPVGGTFAGTLTSGSPTITGVTVPAAVVANGDITDDQALLPAGTTVLSFNAGASTVTLSANALANSSGLDEFTFTTPGMFKIARPLRIQRSYTRIPGASSNAALDYWFDSETMERYNERGFKGNPGPWPIVSAYQPTFPLGTLWVYPNPQASYEVHLFTDLILTEFSNINQDVTLPQGYTRALKKLLSIELCPSWGKTPSPHLLRQGAEARAFIKALNASPVTTLRYDSEIVRSQFTDAGWIVNGGFYGFICGMIGLEMLKWFM